MARQEHIHIITAGEMIHAAFTAAIRDIPAITHTFLFADADLYSNLHSDDEKIRVAKTAVRKSVETVKSISASLAVPCALVYVHTPAFPSARDQLLKIRKDHPGAVFSFDLTAGSKDLSLALFTLALWCRGNVYHGSAGRNGEWSSGQLAVPTVVTSDGSLNPNHRNILSVLSPRQPLNANENRILPRSYLFTQLESFYVPVRKKGVRTVMSPTRTDLYTGKRAVIPILSQGTFTNILSAMVASGLIRESSGPAGNRKEKYYSITPVGEMALQFA